MNIRLSMCEDILAYEILFIQVLDDLAETGDGDMGILNGGIALVQSRNRGRQDERIGHLMCVGDERKDRGFDRGRHG